MDDAATVMAETISQFQGGAGETGAPSALPQDIPSAPITPETQVDGGQPAAGIAPAAGEESNWYDQILNPPQDDLSALLDQQAFQSLQQNPQGLMDWATRAQTHLQTFAQAREQQQKIEQAAEWFGGLDNAETAFQLAGDLFRGNIELGEQERGDFPQATNYAERFVGRVMQQHPQTAYALGAAILNSMPDLLKHNANYLLHQMGLDPKYVEDYKRVALAGGYQMPEGTEAEVEFLGKIPDGLHDAYRRLPADVRQDMRNRALGVAKFELERYAEYFTGKDREAQAQQQREQQQMTQVEVQSQRVLGTETRKVFDEYVEKGKAMGLDALQAAGVAALAAAELDSAYWQDNSDVRRTVDDWFGRIKSGNKLQIDGGRNAYRKAFESAYRKALGQHAPKRPQSSTPPPAVNGNGQQRATSSIPGQPPFTPTQPPAEQANHISAADQMNQILRQYGVIR